MSFRRGWGAIVSVTAVCAVLTPLVPEWRGANKDSFPLSWYPMFANERPTLERPTYVVGVTSTGERVKVDVSYWSRGGFNQGRNELTTIARRGRPELTDFCGAVAMRVGRSKKQRYADVQHLEIVRGKYSRAAYFSGDHTPISERILSSCAVSR